MKSGKRRQPIQRLQRIQDYNELALVTSGKLYDHTQVFSLYK